MSENNDGSLQGSENTNENLEKIEADDIEIVDTDDKEAVPEEPSLEEQLEKSKNDFLYLQAEFENYKRKAIKERSDLIKYGSEHLIRDLLNVLDIFSMALESEVTEENYQQFHQGVEMTSKELDSCLERYGVRKLPALGQAFDPSIHEALSSEESNEVDAGHVLRVFKEAYKMHERVIRPAQVVVAKASVEPTEP